jgi:predicted nucleotidyltransferase
MAMPHDLLGVSAVREPLSHALGTRAKVGCLRILSLIHEPLTQRDLARRAHFQHRTVQLALEELVALGFVSRIEGGRDFLVRLNREHRLAPAVEQIFRQEAEHFLELRRALVEAAGGRASQEVLSIVLFGSAARSEDTLGSDVDTLLIAPDARVRNSALERIESSREPLLERFGVRIHPVGYSLSEARRLWRQRRPPLPEALRDGIVLLGPPLRELLNGKG